MANKRIFYAIHQVGVIADGAARAANQWMEIHGVQSVGITTNFQLEQVFELGQISIYENIENIPDVQVTLQKVLDGYPPIYILATSGQSTSGSLSGRQNGKCGIGLAIFEDTLDSAVGNPNTELVMSGMSVQSLTYNFPVDGNFTEEVTLVGNNKQWYKAGDVAVTFTGRFAANNDSPKAITGSGGVNRREDIIFTHPYHGTIVSRDVNGAILSNSSSLLPQDIDGISASGLNNRNTDGSYSAHIQNISVSTNLNRTELFELGNRTPYHRFVTFPVEVTTAITTYGVSGDLISATEDGVLGNGNNLADRTIQIRTREGLFLFLGRKNKLQSVEYSGGDTGGGNVNITYNYTNFNDMYVYHSSDPRQFHPHGLHAAGL